jgi:hypothetical protein
MCGGCHDIVNDAGVHLERTFAEYQETIFANIDSSENFLSCVSCHMPQREGLVATSTGREGETLELGDVHSHLWPGVDVAMSPWHDREAYEAAVMCVLDTTAITVFEEGTGMASDPLEGLSYMIETQAGHKMPSGASQDRRLWIEVKMFGEDDETPLCTLGAVPEGVAVATFVEPGITCSSSIPIEPGQPAFPLFRDRIFDENGDETHMFWRAAPSDDFDAGFVSFALPGATMPMGTPGDHALQFKFQPIEGAVKVTVRMRMRPMDHDVLEELVLEGLLDESIHDEVRTFTIASASGEYLLEDGGEWKWYPTPDRSTNCADVVVCAFDPNAPECD